MPMTEEVAKMNKESIQDKKNYDMDPIEGAELRALRLKLLAYARIQPHVDSKASTSSIPRIAVLEVVLAQEFYELIKKG
ncbi:hypothetical protein HAX54_017676 [Datura stramonium]|uniref:Uncharacterized protein n=1 Tax=Datura stramonium TaxID=4076 RepID=A0ABS8ULV3_DATST|nr:hypothetical protein [Datura stramonium]